MLIRRGANKPTNETALLVSKQAVTRKTENRNGMLMGILVSRRRAFIAVVFLFLTTTFTEPIMAHCDGGAAGGVWVRELSSRVCRRRQRGLDSARWHCRNPHEGNGSFYTGPVNGSHLLSGVGSACAFFSPSLLSFSSFSLSLALSCFLSLSLPGFVGRVRQALML